MIYGCQVKFLAVRLLLRNVMITFVDVFVVITCVFIHVIPAYKTCECLE